MWESKDLVRLLLRHYDVPEMRLKIGEIMEPGTILCLKTTGELVIVLGEADGVIHVNRPVMGKDGIRHEVDSFFPFELETVEQHLRTELKEMIFKGKLQKEAFAEDQEANLAERKPTDVSIN